MKCPHLRESGHPLCLATPVVRIPNVVDLREYCLTERSAMCPYYESEGERGDAPLSRPASWPEEGALTDRRNGGTGT